MGRKQRYLTPQQLQILLDIRGEKVEYTKLPDCNRYRLRVSDSVWEEIQRRDTQSDTICNSQIAKVPKIKRLFFDIEVSPNIVLSWSVGYELDIPHDNIVQERAIICICWKWEGDSKIHSLQWNKGCDKDMLQKFAKVIDSADEVVTQNGDSFDIKWLRTRCIFHRIPLSVKFNSYDTLKMAKASFRFNSNKLDYMGKFLGIGGKIKTEPDLWKNILLNNDKKSLGDMITYCKMDVQRLEEVFQQLKSYSPTKKFKYKITLNGFKIMVMV